MSAAPQAKSQGHGPQEAQSAYGLDALIRLMVSYEDVYHAIRGSYNLGEICEIQGHVNGFLCLICVSISNWYRVPRFQGYRGHSSVRTAVAWVEAAGRGIEATLATLEKQLPSV